MFNSRFAAAVVFALASASTAFAASPVLAPFPAPGGTTATGTGNAAQGAGRTWALSDFDNSFYDKLYYGVGDYTPDFDPAGPSLTMDGSKDVLSFSSGLSNFAQGKVVWTGTTVFHTFNFGASTIPTRFTLSVTDTSNNPLALTPAGTAGVPSSLGGVLDVQGSFKANWLFEADGPSVSDSYQASLDMFNSSLYQTNPGFSHVSSLGGAFYSTAPITAAIPEPSTYALMLAGLGIVGFVANRRRKAQVVTT